MPWCFWGGRESNAIGGILGPGSSTERAAAKDAIRLWWSRKHGEIDLPHPSLFVIAHDAAGRPYPLTLPSPTSGGEGWGERELPELSIAHTESGAVAIAADVPVGIDIEPATADTTAILSSFATEADTSTANNRSSTASAARSR